MIVCVCKAVSDRHLGQLVRSGVDSVEELQLETGCGTCCGKCLPQVEAMVAQAPTAGMRCVATQETLG